jgi:hypothetical protein
MMFKVMVKSMPEMNYQKTNYNSSSTTVISMVIPLFPSVKCMTALFGLKMNGLLPNALKLLNSNVQNTKMKDVNVMELGLVTIST